MIANHMAPFVEKHPQASLLDIGCATGELLYYLKERYPGLSLFGLDVVPDLIERGKTLEIPAELSVGSLLDENSLPKRKFDLITMSGVHSILDHLEEWLPNLLTLAAPGGQLFVFGPFNTSPVDVWVRYRLSDADSREPDQRGWNVISKKSVAKALKARNLSYTFIPFEIGLDVMPHPDDPLRAWTFKDSQGKRLHTNGTSLLLPFHLLHIRNEAYS